MRTLLTCLTLAAALCATGAAATVDGIKIHSTVKGSGPKTIVFVHGWTCDDSSWDAQVPEFSKTYRVITLDLPGHGKSGAPKDKPLSMDLFARAVEAVRAEAKADKIVLVGHSMGTPVILKYARLYPSHVAGLVPVDGPLHLSGSPNAPNADRMRGPEGLKNREAMIRGMFGPGATPAIQNHILKMMLGAPEATAYQAMSAAFDKSTYTEDPIPVPALAIYAGTTGVRDDAFLKKVFPNGRSVQMPGTGHFVMMEQPAEFNKLLADFLTGVKF